MISDTHGLLRPEAVEALEGSALILHAGDVGDPEILTALEEIAPVTAVRGNMDRSAWAHELPETEVVDVGGIHLYMLHDLSSISLDPVAAGFSVVVSGHTHEPAVEWKDGVLYLNPGSAGARRSRLPVTVAALDIHEDTLEANVIHLAVE